MRTEFEKKAINYWKQNKTFVVLDKYNNVLESVKTDESLQRSIKRFKNHKVIKANTVDQLTIIRVSNGDDEVNAVNMINNFIPQNKTYPVNP